MSHLAVWGNAVLQDVQFSLRSLRKNPGYTVAAVCTLALGVGANCAIFSLIRGVLLRPLPYRNADRVVVLWERNPAQAFEQELVRPGDFADWRNSSQSFEELAFSPDWPGARSAKIINKDGAERVAAACVSANYFSVLGVGPLLGRTFLPEEDRKGCAAVAVLSYSLWQRRLEEGRMSWEPRSESPVLEGKNYCSWCDAATFSLSREDRPLVTSGSNGYHHSASLK
jgi:hypothetical protein